MTDALLCAEMVAAIGCANARRSGPAAEPPRIAGSSPHVWELKNLATVVSGRLLVAALAGAAFGKGAARILLALSALAGIFPWIPLVVF
jgi:hypothetical protein